MYCSDGFILNLGLVLLKLSEPFSAACSPKLLKIQPSYVRVVVSDDAQAKQKGVHAQGNISVGYKISVLFVSANSKGSGESAHMRSLTRTFAACIHKGGK